MKKRAYYGLIVAGMVASLAVAGCGSQSGLSQSSSIAVNTYKLTATDTDIATSFNGTVVAQQSTPVYASVSGRVVEKYVKGGEKVTKGQPLYRLDSRQYEANLASAQATTANSQAAYENAQVNLARYEALAKEDAIARQTLDNQAAVAIQNRATVEANEAAIRLAENNLNDTIVYAPFDGTLEMNDVALGTYITAGQTSLVTLDSYDPAYVQFSMSESEYLEFAKTNKTSDGTANLELTLSDGSIYGEYDSNGKLVQPYYGMIAEVAQNLNSGTGQLVLKAVFPNPGHLLLPNMYASIMAPGDVIKGAILIPTKGIQQVLDKTYVFVVTSDHKVEQRLVTTGGTKGVYTVIKSGLKAGDEVVVDGLTKVKNGAEVTPTVLTKDQIEKGN